MRRAGALAAAGVLASAAGGCASAGPAVVRHVPAASSGPRTAAMVAAPAAVSAPASARRVARRPPVVRAPLLVSGLDDHGLPADARVPLLSAPGGAPLGSVADATLVRVVRSAGDWFSVRSAEGPEAAGWVNDYSLRGTVHVVSPGGCAVRAARTAGGRPGRRLPRNAQARLSALTTSGGHTVVRVRPLGGGAGGWVARAAIRELPNTAACRR